MSFLFQTMSTRRKSLCLDDAMEDGEQKETFRMYRALDLALCLGMGGKSSNVCFESLVQIFSEKKRLREGKPIRANGKWSP